MICSICFLETFTYIVSYPDFKGFVCHDCNLILNAKHNKTNEVIEEEKELELQDCF